MPLIVGNLLTDPDAQSFISLADATAYLAVEGAGAGPETPLGQWLTAGDDVREATLSRASRWLTTLSWCSDDLSDADLVRVGRVAARLAVETTGREMFAGQDVSQIVTQERVDVISVSYAAPGSLKADAAGLSLPWLPGALRGLLCTGSGTKWLMRG